MAKLNNNVTAPIKGDEATQPKKSALQTFLDGLVIPSIEFIVSIFDGTADIDNEAIEHFRSPFVYGGKDSNDLRLLVKTPKLAESVWNVFAVLPAVLPLLDEKGEIVNGEFVDQTDSMKLMTAINTQSNTYRLEARKGGIKVDLHSAVNITAIRNVVAAAVNKLDEKDVRKDSKGIAFSNGEDKTKQVGKFTKITADNEKDLEFSFELVQKIKEVDSKEESATDKTQEVETK